MALTWPRPNEANGGLTKSGLERHNRKLGRFKDSDIDFVLTQRACSVCQLN